MYSIPSIIAPPRFPRMLKTYSKRTHRLVEEISRFALKTFISEKGSHAAENGMELQKTFSYVDGIHRQKWEHSFAHSSGDSRGGLIQNFQGEASHPGRENFQPPLVFNGLLILLGLMGDEIHGNGLGSAFPCPLIITVRKSSFSVDLPDQDIRSVEK